LFFVVAFIIYRFAIITIIILVQLTLVRSSGCLSLLFIFLNILKIICAPSVITPFIPKSCVCEVLKSIWLTTLNALLCITLFSTISVLFDK
jgi:hypothetical protein